MSWTWRVLWLRSAAQRALLLPVLAVAVVGATLLGTFQLLLVTSEQRALEVALDREPASTRDVEAQISLSDGGQGRLALDHASAAMDDLLGPVPADRSTWLASGMYAVAGTSDPHPPFVYLGAYPAVAGASRLVTGAFPTAVVDGNGLVEVAVPVGAAKAYDLHVGSVLKTFDTVLGRVRFFIVTGTFELTGPPQTWTRDVLRGAVHDPAYPVPGSAGTVTTQAWGPLVTLPETFTSGTVTLAQADVLAEPHLAHVAPADLVSLRARLGDANDALAAATKDDVVTGIVRSGLPGAFDSAVAELQVTRIGLVVVGLMLVVVAVTVLLLAARLLAERRAAEQTLMASRGASGRQVLGLAALEALGVAVVTTLVAPWLASWLYRAITSVGALASAGLHDDLGRPASLWLACGVVALVLAGVLLGPVLRRRGSVADAEQQLVRQDARGGVARAGLDLGLVVLAVVALRQLEAYRSPVLAGVGGLGSIDPVLVLAPALVLLAGAVVALRVMPLVARVGERLAARSRALVGSLAAWEVGRRPGRAAGAVLLLTLVVGVGSFAQTLLGTWRTSQHDQVDLATGTDVRVTPGLDTPLEETAAITGVPGVRFASPVVDRSVTIGTRTQADTTTTTLLAVDTTHAADLLRGRVDGGWAARTAALHPDAHLIGAAVPGEPVALELDVASSITPRIDGTLLASLVVQDRLGARTAIDLPSVPAAGGARGVVVHLPAATAGLRIVGLQVFVVPAPQDRHVLASATGVVTLDVSVGNVRAVGPDPSARDAADPHAPHWITAADAPDVAPVSLAGVRWVGLGHQASTGAPSLVTVKVSDDGLRVRDLVDPSRMLAGGQGFAAVSTTDTTAGFDGLPALATPDLLASLGAQVGDRLTLDVGGAGVRVHVAGTVPYLPGEPHADGLLVDSTSLAREALVGASTDPLADEWWLDVRDADAASVVAQLQERHVGGVASRAADRADATDGALHVGMQAALWIVSAAALALAVAGFAMSTAVTVRTRRLELARLQALGASRGGLVRSVLVEYAMLGALGLAAGLLLGALLGARISPLVTVSSSGAPPVPGVLLQWSWPAQAVLLGLLVTLVAAVVATTTNSLLRRASGELLRLGDER